MKAKIPISVTLTLVLSMMLVWNASEAKSKKQLDSRKLLETSSKKLGEEKQWTTRLEQGEHIAWDTPGWGTLKAAYTRILKKPDKVKIDQDNSAYDHPFYRCYYLNGDDSWYMVNLNVGRNPNVASSLKRLIERADGIRYYLASADTFLRVLQIDGDSLIPAKSLHRAGCILRGDTVIWDIDPRTNIPARRIEGKRVYILEDYRRIDGRMVPFHITVYDDGRKAEEFLWKTVAFDLEIDESIFEEYRPEQAK